MRGPRRERLQLAHALVPWLVAGPVLAGIAITLGHIVTTRYPDLGWTQTIANDGRALATGSALYGDPSRQYTGMLYTPLMPVLLAPLYRLLWSDGWSLLISTFAAVGLGTLVAIVAGTGNRDRSRAVRILGGVGVGGLAFWIVATNAWNGVYTGRPDQLAWLFAFGGLCVLALAVAHRWPRVWPAVVLLTAAVWTKQPTAAAVVASIIVATWWAASNTMTWKAWRRFVGGLAAANLALVVGLLAITRGHIWFSIVEIAQRKHVDSAVIPYLSELARLFAIPVIAVALVVVIAWQGLPRLSSRSFAAGLLVLLVAFLLVDLVPVLISRRQQGAGVNGYLGMMWALGFLLALAHREASSRRALTAGVIAYCSVALIVFVPPLRSALKRPKVVAPAAMPRLTVRSIDPAIVAYARSHLVYESSLGVMSPTLTDEVWPHQANVIDVLAAGEPADYFVDALIDRRFDAVTPLSPLSAPYVAAAGRTSVEYVPALNALMQAGYAAGANGAPAPLLGRKPGQMDLSWARACFAGRAPADVRHERRQGPPRESGIVNAAFPLPATDDRLVVPLGGRDVLLVKHGLDLLQPLRQPVRRHVRARGVLMDGIVGTPSAGQAEEGVEVLLPHRVPSDVDDDEVVVPCRVEEADHRAVVELAAIDPVGDGALGIIQVLPRHRSTPIARLRTIARVDERGAGLPEHVLDPALEPLLQLACVQDELRVGIQLRQQRVVGAFAVGERVVRVEIAT